MKHALVFPYVWRKAGDIDTGRERETVRHMLSRQPTFQLSDRVSHELKVICRLIDASVGVNTEEGRDIRAIEFPLGFWARQANFVATCSSAHRDAGVGISSGTMFRLL